MIITSALTTWRICWGSRMKFWIHLNLINTLWVWADLTARIITWSPSLEFSRVGVGGTSSFINEEEKVVVDFYSLDSFWKIPLLLEPKFNPISHMPISANIYSFIGVQCCCNIWGLIPLLLSNFLLFQAFDTYWISMVKTE